MGAGGRSLGDASFRIQALQLGENELEMQETTTLSWWPQRHFREEDGLQISPCLREKGSGVTQTIRTHGRSCPRSH